MGEKALKKDQKKYHKNRQALTCDMALGCSTNTVLHLLAIANEAGVPLDLNLFNEISEKTPNLCHLAPAASLSRTLANSPKRSAKTNTISSAVPSMTSMSLCPTPTWCSANMFSTIPIANTSRRTASTDSISLSATLPKSLCSNKRIPSANAPLSVLSSCSA